MPRYELVEGTSKKFWEIALDGASFTTTYGRIGTDGQTTMKEYDSEEKAQREYDKLVAEKVKKGYVLAGGESAPAAPAPAPAPAPTKAAAAAAAPPPAKPARPAKGAVFDDEGDDDDAPKKPAPKPASKPAQTAKAAPAAPAGASKSGEEGARYFEYVDGSSSKFWEIKLEGSSFTTRYGRIGTDGQMSMKEYDSQDKAQREYDKLVAEKTKKGYVEK